MSCWWRVLDGSSIVHCDHRGVYLCGYMCRSCSVVCVCGIRKRSYAAHVDNLVSWLHSLHLWWRWWGMENRRRQNRGGNVCVCVCVDVGVRERKKTREKCDLTSEELYGWFMLLHMEQFTPSAAVLATCAIWFHNSFPVLGNSFISRRPLTLFPPVSVLLVLSWHRVRCTI